jgi:L-threonylcarbamoyladenylate synthase
VEDAKKIVREWPAEADKCAKEFWPGPLTIVLPKTGAVPEIVSGGLDTVAIRMRLIRSLWN